MPRFKCKVCGVGFEVPQAALDKYPGWKPKYCREHSPNRKSAASKIVQAMSIPGVIAVVATVCVAVFATRNPWALVCVFIAAIPGLTWHAKDRAETGRALREVFPADENIDRLLGLEHHPIPGRQRMSYRMRGFKSDYGPFEYEHQVYYSVVGERIERLRILCSGFYRPEGE